MPIAKVTEGLWIGGLPSLVDVEKHNVTALLSIINSPYDLDQAPARLPSQHLQLDLEDIQDANLLQLLPKAVEFIHTARAAGGNVLVHCAAGVSRSAAVVVAYLMASQQPSPTPSQALALLRQSHPQACPNAGFMQQLELFHAMGCRLQEGHLPYKRFLLEMVGRRYEETGELDTDSLAQLTDLGDGEATLYRCRKCRALVATEHNVVDVEAGPGAAAFPWRKRDKHQRQMTNGDETGGSAAWEGEGECSSEGRRAGGGSRGAGGRGVGEGSLFVEPMSWMAGMVVGGPVQGKLYCPKCQARLGSFNWSGAQSSSGAWVVPSFQLHVSKLDAVDPRPPAQLAHALRQPRILAGGNPSMTPARNGPGQSWPHTPAAAAAACNPQQGGGQGAGGAEGPGGTVDAGYCREAAAGGEGSALAAGGGRGRAVARGPFTHLLLDCDGVMVDSERASCGALRLAILEVTGFDIPHDFPSDFQPVFGMDVRSCVEYYQERFGRQDWGDAAAVAVRVAAAKEGIYRRLTEGGVSAFAGVAQLIVSARALGMGVAVASSGTPEKIRHNLSSSGLWELLDPHLVVSAKYVPRGKPAPDVYLEALKRVGCHDAARALVVEDAVNGLIAARAAGCYAVGITNSLPREFLEPHADAVVDVITEVSALFQVNQEAE